LDEPLRLADAIKRAQGVAIHGNFKRYGRPRWHHSGDTGVSSQNGGTLHAYTGHFEKSIDNPVWTVFVDLFQEEIKPFEKLDADSQALVRKWLSEKGLRCDY